MQTRFYKVFTLVIVVSILAACGSKKAIKTTREDQRTTKNRQIEILRETDEKVTKTIKPVYKDQVSSYIAQYADVAMKEMQLYNIPASITLAQGILESGSGKGRLAVEANNHFGVKCHRGWTGGRIYHDDDEDQECFRKYKDASYSYRDHSLFLTDRKRYAKLFTHDLDDYKAWAKGLRAAGYATDKRYPQKLISLIERYQLYNYDQQVLGNSYVSSQGNRKTTTRETYTVQKGDTLYSLSRRFNTTVDQIKKLNDLSSNEISIGSTLTIEPNTKN